MVILLLLAGTVDTCVVFCLHIKNRSDLYPEPSTCVLFFVFTLKTVLTSIQYLLFLFKAKKRISVVTS